MPLRDLNKSNITDTVLEQVDFPLANHAADSCAINYPPSFLDNDSDWRTKLTYKLLNFLRNGCD